MDKIRIDIFDVLGYIVPGLALLIVGWIAADSQVQSIWQTYKSINQVDTKVIYLSLFLSYFLGFLLHIIGSSLYNMYRKLRKLNSNSTDILSVPEKWALIREYGDKHIPILERWYALRAFSQNLAAISLICLLVCLYKYFVFGYYEWLISTLIFIAGFFVLLKRTAIFHDILYNDMEAVMNKLHLKEK